ncbi:MAG: hypothetical protein AAF830_17025 [Pseudomonadota bacterium]
MTLPEVERSVGSETDLLAGFEGTPERKSTNAEVLEATLRAIEEDTEKSGAILVVLETVNEREWLSGKLREKIGPECYCRASLHAVPCDNSQTAKSTPTSSEIAAASGAEVIHIKTAAKENAVTIYLTEKDRLKDFFNYYTFVYLIILKVMDKENTKDDQSTVSIERRMRELSDVCRRAIEPLPGSDEEKQEALRYILNEIEKWKSPEFSAPDWSSDRQAFFVGKPVVFFKDAERGFAHRKETHYRLFRQCFGREPASLSSDDYTPVDFLFEIWGPAERLRALSVAELSGTDLALYDALASYRRRHNKFFPDDPIETVDALFLRPWTTPRERSFQGVDLSAFSTAAIDVARQRTAFDHPEDGFEARRARYRNAFRKAHGHLPRRGKNEDYLCVDFLTDEWGDAIAAGVLSAPVLRQSDPRLYRAINSYVSYSRRECSSIEPVTLDRVVSTPRPQKDPQCLDNG